MTESKLPKSAIVFKPGDGRGGAQTYVSRVAEWIDSPVHVLYSDLDKSDWGRASVVEFGSRPTLPLIGRRAIGSFLDRLEYAFWTPPSEFDVIVSSGLVTKAVQHRPGQTRIHLAHGFHRGAFGLPPRGSFSDNRFVEMLQKANRLSVRRNERQALDQMDILVVNSEFTKGMIEHYMNTTVDRIIHPPVTTSDYYDARPNDEQFYLYLGRLDEVKGVRQIVKAFDKLPYQLRVAGEGALKKELESQAGSNVNLLGYVSEIKKRELMANCQGFIQNSIIEDFGITTVEAMASGAPVIAVNHQNNPNLVTERETGILFESSQTTEPLIEAVEVAETIDWDHDSIQHTAEKYNTEHCRKKWRELLNDIK